MRRQIYLLMAANVFARGDDRVHTRWQIRFTHLFNIPCLLVGLTVVLYKCTTLPQIHASSANLPLSIQVVPCLSVLNLFKQAYTSVMLYCVSELEHSQNPVLLLCVCAVLTSPISLQEEHHLQMSYAQIHLSSVTKENESYSLRQYIFSSIVNNWECIYIYFNP